MSTGAPETLLLDPGDTMPNNRLPVLIYRSVLDSGEFEWLFGSHGWHGMWRDGVYDYDHYHSNAHEVLGLAIGQAALQIGGETGQRIEIKQGDALVLPAGTGHRRINRSEDFVMVGAYPPGQEHYDICRERSLDAELRISKVKLPTTDPVRGREGPLVQLWK